MTSLDNKCLQFMCREPSVNKQIKRLIGTHLYTRMLAGCWGTWLWSSLFPMIQWATYSKFSWKWAKFKRNSKDARRLLNAYCNFSYWILTVIYIQILAFSSARNCYLGVSLALPTSFSPPFGSITLCSYTCLYHEFQPSAIFTRDKTNRPVWLWFVNSWDSKKIGLSLYIRWFSVFRHTDAK